jgi:hypothetical protein
MYSKKNDCQIKKLLYPDLKKPAKTALFNNIKKIKKLEELNKIKKYIKLNAIECNVNINLYFFYS